MSEFEREKRDRGESLIYNAQLSRRRLTRSLESFAKTRGAHTELEKFRSTVEHQIGETSYILRLEASRTLNRLTYLDSEYCANAEITITDSDGSSLFDVSIPSDDMERKYSIIIDEEDLKELDDLILQLRIERDPDDQISEQLYNLIAVIINRVSPDSEKPQLHYGQLLDLQATIIAALCSSEREQGHDFEYESHMAKNGRTETLTYKREHYQWHEKDTLGDMRVSEEERSTEIVWRVAGDDKNNMLRVVLDDDGDVSIRGQVDGNEIVARSNANFFESEECARTHMVTFRYLTEKLDEFANNGYTPDLNLS